MVDTIQKIAVPLTQAKPVSGPDKRTQESQFHDAERLEKATRLPPAQEWVIDVDPESGKLTQQVKDQNGVVLTGVSPRNVVLAYDKMAKLKA